MRFVINRAKRKPSPNSCIKHPETTKKTCISASRVGNSEGLAVFSYHEKKLESSLIPAPSGAYTRIRTGALILAKDALLSLQIVDHQSEAGYDQHNQHDLLGDCLIQELAALHSQP